MPGGTTPSNDRKVGQRTLRAIKSFKEKEGGETQRLGDGRGFLEKVDVTAPFEGSERATQFE